ncbi:MAG: bifunctional glutamate N-acetyltransferase/amino-acid acetyltransferase ArgJ [Spirochaetales bacterium]|nr:bifunctional glutamate N-acetyltransferase/amino-acid acetyltransferase ArgJ [Spirochaetales bacterium]
MTATTQLPSGFKAGGWNAGIKQGQNDFGVILSEEPSPAHAVFTRNNFPGNPIIVGREHIAGGLLQAIIVNSGNSNVATGPEGLALVREYVAEAARTLGIRPDCILPSSTGVIGRPLPRSIMLEACRQIPERIQSADLESFSRSILTTDRWPKQKSIRLQSGVTITGVAKGAGMIAPDMATMLAYILTDAKIEATTLQSLLRWAVDLSFNRISVDSDTSTSDTVVLWASGRIGPEIRLTEQERKQLGQSFPWEFQADFLADHEREFVAALREICLFLAGEIVRDGEGATRVFEVRILGARNRDEALLLARSLVNSPLLKTAIHGADPNWGRLIMAIGKVFTVPVAITDLRIFLGEMELTKDADLAQLRRYLENPLILIQIHVGQGPAAERMWGCDLTADYVAINALYTT